MEAEEGRRADERVGGDGLVGQGQALVRWGLAGGKREGSSPAVEIQWLISSFGSYAVDGLWSATTFLSAHFS